MQNTINKIEKFKNSELNRFCDFTAIMPDLVIKNKELLLYLNKENFFTAPASTRFHGNYPGGLYDHSLAVTNSLIELTEKLGLKWERPESPYIVGMFHDLCKIDQYITYGNGSIVYNKSSDRRHAEKSLDLLSKFIQLTDEEYACILCHMGAYETEHWNRFGDNIKKYPNVLYTHTADMIASHIFDI